MRKSSTWNVRQFVKVSFWTLSLDKWNDWAHGPAFEAWEATSGQRHFVHFVFHAAGTVCVWSDVNVSPCDQQDREDLCLFGITNASWWKGLMEIGKLHVRVIEPGCMAPCDVGSHLDLKLVSPGDGGLCCVLRTLWSAPCISSTLSSHFLRYSPLVCSCINSWWALITKGELFYPFSISSYNL